MNRSTANERKLADEGIRPEKQHEADGRDHAWHSRARQFQLHDEADDAQHDEYEIDDGLTKELGNLFEPIVAGDADLLRIKAVMSVQIFDGTDVGRLGDMKLFAQAGL